MSKLSPQNDSVSKSLRILQLLACHESMRVTELSRELDVAPSTAHRLLNIMRSHDFVEQDAASPRYRLGPAALQLGRPAREQANLAPVSHPHLARLSADLDETVNLVVLDGPDALFLDGIQSGQPLRVATRTGARIPAYATAGGKALLAHIPYQSLRSLYPDGLRRITQFTLPDMEALQHELQKVRERGYSLNLGEHLTEVYAIGVPVFSGDRSPVAAITATGPVTRWNRRALRALAPTLTRTAEDIARDLADAAQANAVSPCTLSMFYALRVGLGVCQQPLTLATPARPGLPTGCAVAAGQKPPNTGRQGSGGVPQCTLPLERQCSGPRKYDVRQRPTFVIVGLVA